MTSDAGAKTLMKLKNEQVYKVCNNVHVHINTADAYDNILRQILHQEWYFWQ